MSWQRCPICNGTGIDPNPGLGSSNACPVCPTCEGKRIISELTGLPPVTGPVYQYPTVSSPTVIDPVILIKPADLPSDWRQFYTLCETQNPFHERYIQTTESCIRESRPN